MAVVGLDLGGTKFAAALFADCGEILHRQVVPLGHRGGADAGALAASQIRDLLAAAARQRIDIAAVGVSIPGISRARTGTVWAPNIPGWTDYPLREEILRALGGLAIPVAIDSDRACSILGEAWLGAARGCADAIFLAVGTGIGAGILVNGELLRGADDLAGAIGWLALDRPFRPPYSACGCFEHHASGAGIAALARQAVAADPTYRGPLREARELTARHVFDAFAADDPVAGALLRQTVEFWGMAAANLVSLFNPRKLIFGGGVFGPALQFLDAIRAEAARWAQPIAMEAVTFEASTLGGDAALIGAGSLALRSLPDAR